MFDLVSLSPNILDKVCPFEHKHFAYALLRPARRHARQRIVFYHLVDHLLDRERVFYDRLAEVLR